MDITQAIYNALTADATLTGLIGNYGPGSPGQPCVFTAWPIPSDAPKPYIYTRGEVSTVPFDLADAVYGLDMLRDVTVIAENTGSELAVEAIARRVKTVLHRQPLTIPSGQHIMSICVAGPIIAETDDTLTGRILTFRIVAKEN